MEKKDRDVTGKRPQCFWKKVVMFSKKHHNLFSNKSIIFKYNIAAFFPKHRNAFSLESCSLLQKPAFADEKESCRPPSALFSYERRVNLANFNSNCFCPK